MNWLEWLLSKLGGKHSARNQLQPVLLDQPERIPMPLSDPERFWSIIGQTTGEENETGQCAALKRVLEGLPERTLIAFDADYRRMLKAANTWDLWAAAYIINGGCSDDGFDYFRDWLISAGIDVYENAIVDPETLIGKAKPYETEFEEFRYMVQDVFEAKYGKPLPWFEGESVSPPSGIPFDEETVSQKFPQLAQWVSQNG